MIPSRDVLMCATVLCTEIPSPTSAKIVAAMGFISIPTIILAKLIAITELIKIQAI